MTPPILTKTDIYAIVPGKKKTDDDVKASVVNTSNFLTRKAKENHERFANDSRVHTAHDKGAITQQIQNKRT